jgi:hypothetical protein
MFLKFPHGRISHKVPDDHNCHNLFLLQIRHQNPDKALPSTDLCLLKDLLVLVRIFALKDSIDNRSRRANNLAGTHLTLRIKTKEIPGGELDILGPDILHKDASVPAHRTQPYHKALKRYILKKKNHIKSFNNIE